MKKLSLYFLSILWASLFFCYEFFPKYPKEYYENKKTLDSLEVLNSKALEKLKDYAKNSPTYNQYLETNKKYLMTQEIFTEAKKNDNYFGFNSPNFFVFNTCLYFGILIYALFNIINALNSDSNNLGIQIIHSYIISVCLFKLSWIFLTYQDFNDAMYIFMLFLSVFVITKATNLLIKQKQRQLVKLKTMTQKAEETFDKLRNEIFLKQQQERAEERRRIGEELHDGILGKLLGTRLGLGFLVMSDSHDKKKYEVFLKELKEIEKEISDVTHKLNTNLNGTDIGFKELIENLIKHNSTIGDFSYKTTIEETIDWLAFNEENRVNIYRILQEGLQNIIKHAKCSHVHLSLTNLNDFIGIELKDNGVGFESKNSNGIGIRNIKSRVKRLKGSFTIASEPNKGTTIKIQIPYKPQISLT